MNLSKELPIETGPTSADTGGFGSSIEAKSMGKASPIPSLLGRLHKSRYSPSRYHEPGEEVKFIDDFGYQISLLMMMRENF